MGMEGTGREGTGSERKGVEWNGFFKGIINEQT